MMNHIKKFKAARRAAVPLIAVETADPNATMLSLIKAMNGKTTKDIPVLRWDSMRSVAAMNQPGADLISAWVDSPIEVSAPFDFVSYLYSGVEKVMGKNYMNYTGEPSWRGALVFILNAHRYIDDTQIMQGVWNLRDLYKTLGATVVLLGPAFKLPPEIAQDVIVITEEYPASDQIQSMAKLFLEEIKAKGATFEIEARQLATIGETLTGTSMFGAEQTLAMCTQKDGVDFEMLWDQKCKIVSQTRGLKVWRGKETFEDLKGCRNIMEFAGDILKGPEPPMAIGFIDEIEKGMAGARSDLSGTGQDQLQCFLTEMQDNDIPGMLLVGHPGTGKSMFAKCMGNLIGIPTVSIDFGAMKGSLVGQSEQQVRAAWQVLKAISNGKILMVATSNGLSNLPPELKRRFYMGTYMFDLPLPEEREVIWKLYIEKMKLNDQEIGFNDDGWTGAEIRACCELARRTRRPISEAWKRISPLIKTNPKQIDQLREEARGRFLSASYSGLYRGPEESTKSIQPEQKRAMSL